jgi:hypothetical protein
MKEGARGTGEYENGEQAVHLSHQEVGMAVEGDGDGAGRSARGEMPHLRRDPHGAGLRVAHPVGGVGKGLVAAAWAQVKDPLHVAPAVEAFALDSLAVALEDATADVGVERRRLDAK